MRRPGFLTLPQIGGSQKSLLRRQFFQRGEPVLIVAGAVVRIAPFRRRFQFSGQRLYPLFPGEMPLCRQPHGEGEDLRLPGLGENRASLVLRNQRRQFEGARVRHAQRSYPTNPGEPSHAARRPRPTVLARQSARDQRVQSGGFDQPFFHQEGFERLGSQRRVRRDRLVLVLVFVRLPRDSMPY